MNKSKRPTNKRIAAVYIKKACNVSLTCEALHISRNTFYEWRKKDSDLDELLKEKEESMLDYAESKLMEAIQDDNLTATIFFLKTKGKNRGYVERIENDMGNAFENLMKELDADNEDDDESE